MVWLPGQFLLQQGFHVDIHKAMFPPLNPEMDLESITDKWDNVLWALDTFSYLLMSHRNKLWFMEKHETLIEARTMFGAMYNPIKHIFDMYVNDKDMPSTYLECIFNMRYREYMRWEIVHLTVDLEVSCRYLKAYTEQCIMYKCLDLLCRIITKCKCVLEKYCVHNAFWEQKIKK